MSSYLSRDGRFLSSVDLTKRAITVLEYGGS